ncbi:MAG: ATP-binding protein [Burkholderiaceae bacterium]
MKILRYLRDAAVFAPCYIALDWASYVYPLGPFNITPWNPQPALAIVWMLLGGLRYLPAVLVTIFVADVVIRHAPGGYEVTAMTSLALAGGYAAIAQLLRALLSPARALDSTRHLTVFSAVTIGGTAIVSAAFIGVLWMAAFLSETSLPNAWLQFWVGDGVGVLVTAPLLLAAADAQSRQELLKVAMRPETMMQGAALVATIWIVFVGLPGDPAQHFYLLFLPLIWIAVRGGMSGALIAVTIVQLGVVVAIHRATTTLPVLELQAFVAALTLTALYLGMTVDERQRSAVSLRQTLRLAAAGEMAGALAHEVNQPLTALANYGRSAQLLLADDDVALNELSGVIEKMLSEGKRAGEVVRRLRDFFRTGTTQLESVSVDQILATAQSIGQQLGGSSTRILIETASEGELPALFVDRLQIELILRNLISNAIEAIGERTDEPGQIQVMAQQHDAQHVRLTVTDNGPGVSAGVRARLFEPFSSDKSRGMGLGLAVSRAIAEAHGGSLVAGAGEHGEFQLVLPCTQTV